MALPTERVVEQINSILGMYTDLRSRSEREDCRDQPTAETSKLLTLMCDAVRRFAPEGSEYILSMEGHLKNVGGYNASAIPYLKGILTALHDAYDAGYMATVTELVHADIFSDFLQMAQYLQSEGYKDAAAVISGSVLEEHLRKLSVKHGIAAERPHGRPVKADSLNNELASRSAYSKLDQKSITAWLDLRNKAAHGRYDEYTTDQVDLLIRNVRNFLARVRA